LHFSALGAATPNQTTLYQTTLYQTTLYQTTLYQTTLYQTTLYQTTLYRVRSVSLFISCLSDGAPAMLGFHARIMPEADQGTVGLIKFALPEEKGARRLVLAPAQAGVGRPLAQGFSPGKRTANVPEKIGSAFKNMVESLGHHGTEYSTATTDIFLRAQKKETPPMPTKSIVV